MTVVAIERYTDNISRHREVVSSLIIAKGVFLRHFRKCSRIVSPVTVITFFGRFACLPPFSGPELRIEFNRVSVREIIISCWDFSELQLISSWLCIQQQSNRTHSVCFRGFVDDSTASAI